MLLVVSSGLAGSAAAAEEDAALRPAWQAYQRREFDRAEELVRRLLPRLGSARQQRDANLVLAACAHARGLTVEAEDRVVTAYALDPDFRPDPLRFPPELLRLIDGVRTRGSARIARRRMELARQAAASQLASRPASQPPPTNRPPGPRPAIVDRPALAAPRPTPIYLAVAPFGIGQFANAQRTKAWLLLGLESALVVSSVSCLAALLALRGDDGYFTQGDTTTARGLNIAYLASAYAAAALMIYGAIDGLYYRRRGISTRHAVQITGGRRSLGLGATLRF